MRFFRVPLPLAALTFAAACDVGAPFDTGLEGHVVRSPTSPVCAPPLGCEAPFASDFTVWSVGLLVARFRSDSAGAFMVRLPPGTYNVMADSTAPVVPGQRKVVLVKAESFTSIVLDFDTGIR